MKNLREEIISCLQDNKYFISGGIWDEPTDDIIKLFEKRIDSLEERKVVEDKIYYCDYCKKNITFRLNGKGVVYHFFEKHPIVIFNILNEEYPSTFLEISRMLRNTYMRLQK